MKRYPHTTPWAPAMGFAALASIATLAVTVLLPAAYGPPAETSVAPREAAAPQATVKLERIDVVVKQRS
jgi:hypothetical protein